MLKLYCGKSDVANLKGKIRDFRPCWLLEELRAPYERVYLDIKAGEQKQPAYKQIHPLGKVPAINDDGFVLFESGAIVNYLATKFGGERWIPDSYSKTRAIYDQWFCFSTSTVEPLMFRIVGPKLFGDDATHQANLKQFGQNLSDALAVLNQHFAQNNFVMGANFTAVDIVVGHTLFIGDIPEVLADFSNIRRYVDGIKARSGFKRAYSFSLNLV
jgi:glutathione S-transferase